MTTELEVSSISLGASTQAGKEELHPGHRNLAVRPKWWISWEDTSMARGTPKSLGIYSMDHQVHRLKIWYFNVFHRFWPMNFHDSWDRTWKLWAKRLVSPDLTCRPASRRLTTPASWSRVENSPQLSTLDLLRSAKVNTAKTDLENLTKIFISNYFLNSFQHISAYFTSSMRLRILTRSSLATPQQPKKCPSLTEEAFQFVMANLPGRLAFSRLISIFSIHCMGKIGKTYTGWWLGHPSEKYESQLGWFETQYMGK